MFATMVSESVRVMDELTVSNLEDYRSGRLQFAGARSEPGRGADLNNVCRGAMIFINISFKTAIRCTGFGSNPMWHGD